MNDIIADTSREFTPQTPFAARLRHCSIFLLSMPLSDYFELAAMALAADDADDAFHRLPAFIIACRICHYGRRASF